MKIQHKFNLNPILCILVIIEFIGLVYLYNKPSDQINTENINKVVLVIDSLVVEQNSLLNEANKQDSIIKEIKKTYSTDSTFIINQSLCEDLEFFTNYLSSYIK